MTTSRASLASVFTGPTAMAVGPVATMVMPFRVPQGFHAGWVGAEQAPFRCEAVMCSPGVGVKADLFDGQCVPMLPADGSARICRVFKGPVRR